MQDELVAILDTSRDLGFLGPGPVEPHIAHASALVPVLTAAGLDPAGEVTVLDLGSGGGLPGLVLALALPHWRFVLLDANERRTAFLNEAVVALGIDPRVEVYRARAEEAGRSSLRGAADVVVARSFGAPAVTAECAAPVLRVGGHLFVSEPPDPAEERWPVEGLAEVGLELAGMGSWAHMRQVVSCPDRYPRRVGVPTKRPLW
ncbi:MAG: RsmG family class I SAM-dependent methyltransferase [Acidimicrobiales bacterium]